MQSHAVPRIPMQPPCTPSHLPCSPLAPPCAPPLPQENAFWLLVQLVEATLLEGTYSQNLAGCAVEMRTLEALIAAKLPRLAAHMAALEADVSLFAMDW